jgi:hypothetical protein
MGRNRAVAVTAAVLSALVLVVLAAGSDRAATLTPREPLDVVIVLPEGPEELPEPDGGRADPAAENPDNIPEPLFWALTGMSLLLVGMAVWFLRHLVSVPSLRRRLRFGPVARADEPVPKLPDEARAELAGAVADGLRELDQGGPGAGVLASWVLLERAAADAGTHRAAPDTPSELAGKLIDRHGVSSGPLLRLAELYRGARFSRHAVPESSRTEARAALEQLRAELAAHPIGGRR